MAPLATPAIVLQTFRYSETSKIVRLATRDLGVQSGIAKGALRPKSRFGAGLEILSEGVVEIYYRDSRDLQTLSAFEVFDLHRGLAGDLTCFSGAAALAQVLLKAGPPSPVPAAYDALARGLAALDRAEPGTADALALRWLWVLLGALGFEPSLSTCVKDGTPVVSNGTPVAFSLADGGVLCEQCTPQVRGPVPLTRLPAQAYRDLVMLNDTTAVLPAFDDAHAAAHRRLVARFARYHMGDSGQLLALDFWERQSWAHFPPPPRTLPSTLPPRSPDIS
jgi:DNA repair protein RecO (recombination protein O)